MIGELLKFGALMLVVMLGFSMSFYSLFSELDTYSETWLGVFKAMLGEVGLFEDFVGRQYETAATLLLIFYIVVITIMLLNLLVAVLSTSHSKVQERAEREFKVSKAHLVQYYRVVVDDDLLPPPFNLVQLVVSLPFKALDRSWSGEINRRVKKVVGCVVFWLVLGPVALVVGGVLWPLSSCYSCVSWRKFSMSTEAKIDEKPMPPARMLLRYMILFVFCTLIAPLWLLALWLQKPIAVFHQVLFGECRELGLPLSLGCQFQRFRRHTRVDNMLKKTYDGLVVKGLRKYLDDPMSDPKVRQDETNRATTVEHVKLLRDRLESTFAANVEQQAEVLDKRIDKLELTRRGETEALVAAQKKTNDDFVTQHEKSIEGLHDRLHKLDGKIEELDGKWDRKVGELNGKLAELIEKLNLVLAFGAARTFNGHEPER